MLNKIGLFVFIIFFNIIISFDIIAQPECILACQNGSGTPAQICECYSANSCDLTGFLDENGEPPCVPINTHTWVLYILGGSLVLVGYVIACKNKV